MINVAEVFMSYQGEGPLSGSRTLFIRLQGCNQRCQWCDTKYAIGETMGTEYTAQDLFDKIKEFRVNQFDSFDICITGGEPLLQQMDPELREFVAWAGIHHRLTLETNGTVIPETKFISCFDHISISPKLQATGMKNDVDVDTLMKVSDVVFSEGLPIRIIYKYVVDPNNMEGCIAEIQKIHDQFPVESVDIFLMPITPIDANEGDTIEGTRKIKQCLMKNNLPYSITTRLHLAVGAY